MQCPQFHKEGIQQYIYIPVSFQEADYCNQLLQYHPVPGFLQYEIRDMNGQCYLYYHLRYKTSLKAVGEHIVLNEEMVFQMMESVILVLESAREYLLRIDNILWSMDYIFIEAETGRLEFCYYPEKVDDNDITKWMSELIFLVGKKNERIRFSMLQFYNYITEPDKTRLSFSDFQKEYLQGSMIPEKETMEEQEKEAEISEESLKGNEKKNLFEIGIKVFAIINGVLLFLLLFQILPDTYFPFMMVTLGLLIGMIAIAIFTNKEDSPEEIMEDYFRQEKESCEVKEPEQRDIYYGETSVLTSDGNKEQMVLEETIKELYLFPFAEKKYLPICVKEKTIIVGCMEENCDYVIREKGISRLHAKLIKRESGLYLLDLNSTNGTYLNGELLKGGVEYLLEEGDTIAFFQTEFYVQSNL